MGISSKEKQFNVDLMINLLTTAVNDNNKDSYNEFLDFKENFAHLNWNKDIEDNDLETLQSLTEEARLMFDIV